VIILTSEAATVINRIDQLLPKTARRVSFITSAANPDSEKPWVDADRNALISTGREILPLDIAKIRGHALEKQLQQSEIIFVCGGNTFYLLQESHRSGFSKILPSLLAEGRHYIGSSAGSVLVGSSLTPIRSLDEPSEAADLQSEDGLNLVPFVPLVHFGKEKYLAKYLQVFEAAYRNGNTIVSIRDDQLLVYSENSVRWG
jgi:dipeptidase E